MLKKKWFVPLLASLTLGLAPFTPEPHIWGKLKWLIGGAKGMLPMDWFDLVMHGFPFIWLAYEVYVILKKR